MSEKQMDEHLFSYRFGGKEWCTSVFADSEAEAREKIKAQGMARYDGPLVARIPAYAGLRADFLVDLICRARNWWVRK